jgi:predicted transcriptional regulator
MAREAVTIRMDSEKRAALDAVAAALGRDRSDLIDAAIDAYLDAYRRQVAHIEEGVRQADAGELASDAEVAALFERFNAISEAAAGTLTTDEARALSEERHRRLSGRAFSDSADLLREDRDR